MDEELDEYWDNEEDEERIDDEDFDLDECGITQFGDCQLVGTEFCDWDCPVRKALLVDLD